MWLHFIHCPDICIHTYVTGPGKINHVSTKILPILFTLLYHNLITIYTTATKSSSLLEGFHLKLMEMSYYILNGRY